MGNDSAKKRILTNTAVLRKYNVIILAVNATYVAHRMYYLWATFSRWHIAAFVMTSLVYAVTYIAIIRKAAAARWKPLSEGGALISGGDDLDQKGVLEYCWDMLYVTMLVQLGSGFISDWFWMLYTVPPGYGFYHLWVTKIYPWISKPDDDGRGPEAQLSKTQEKKQARYNKSQGR